MDGKETFKVRRFQKTVNFILTGGGTQYCDIPLSQLGATKDNFINCVLTSNTTDSLILRTAIINNSHFRIIDNQKALNPQTDYTFNFTVI